jgi:hypothetical protein
LCQGDTGNQQVTSWPARVRVIWRLPYNQRAREGTESGQDLFEHTAMHVGQAEVAPRVAEGQPLVIEAEAINRCPFYFFRRKKKELTPLFCKFIDAGCLIAASQAGLMCPSGQPPGG